MLRVLPWLGALIGLSAVAFVLSNYETDIYRKLLLWVALALSFNFLFGISGQIAFSHFAFYGIGGYAIVILTFQVGLPLPLAAVGAAAVCALLALIVAIPATRLEGFYLALATLAFAQLFLVVLSEGGELTGEDSGLSGYVIPAVFGWRMTGAWYTIVIVAVVLATLAILLRIDRSWFGRACRAVRDNPEAAAAMGVNVARTKVIAFALTSTLAGVAGMAYAFVDNIVSPPVFNLENVFLLLFMIIVGGSGRHFGAIVGCVVLYLTPFFLEPIVGKYHLLVFGFVVVFAILFQRQGLIGLWDIAIRALRAPSRGNSASGSDS